MEKYNEYSSNFKGLVKNENNIMFFCNVIRDNIKNKPFFCSELIDNICKFCDNNQLEKAKIKLLSESIWYFFDNDKYEKSLELCNTLYKYFKKLDLKSELAYTYYSFASIYFRLGYYDLASEFSYKGIKLSKKLGNREILYKLLLNLALFNISNKDFENSSELIKYINLNFESNEIYSNNILLYTVIGYIKSEDNNTQEALEYLNKALIYGRNYVKFAKYLPLIYRAYAFCLYKQGNKKEADKYFTNSFINADENNLIFEKCETLLEWSIFHLNTSNEKIAIEDLKGLLKMASEHNFLRHISVSSKLLYKNYKKHNNFVEALSNLEIYKDTNEKINNKYIDEITNVTYDTLFANKKIAHILYNNTEFISSLGQKIISKINSNEILQLLNDEIHNLIDTDYTGLSIYDERKKTVTIKSIIRGTYVEKTVDINTADSFFSYCIKTNRSIMINDFESEYKLYVNNVVSIVNGDKCNAAHSSIYIPLSVNNKIVGIITTQSLKSNAFDENDFSVLKIIANYVAIAIKNSIEFQEIEKDVVYDNLTGFLAKREILALGEEYQKQFSKTKEPFCILMLDIDNFKYINNNYGHVAGDQVLRMLAQTIQRVIRKNDFIGRFGGDEFLLICPNAEKSTIISIAERIRKVVQNTDFIIDNGIHIEITLSIGLHEFNDVNETFSEGIANADNYLYIAKNTSKNAVI